MEKEGKIDIHFVGNMERDEFPRFVLRHNFGKAVVIGDPCHENPDIANELREKGFVGVFEVGLSMSQPNPR